jgi:glutathione reductase (NADPH)
MARFDYDLITIGAGSGGVRASRLAGGYGARVAVIEQSRIGGTCVMRGCVPKKLLVMGAHYAEDFADAAGFGWTIDGARLDWGALITRKNAELDRLEGVYRTILGNNKVELIEGSATVTDPHSVAVNGRTLTAERILIAAGGWPASPPLPGIAHAITSNEALDLPALPRRVVIAGGGYIAVEFAGIFRAAGSEVTLVIRAPSILRGFDDEVRAFLGNEMEKKGIVIRRGVHIARIERAGPAFEVHLDNGEVLACDQVMSALGRNPNTAALGLAEAGVALAGNGAVIVDGWNQSSVPSIFAVGDCTDRMNLTPVAIAEGRAFAETVFNNNPIQVDYRNIASAVFSQPPVGTVGLSEAEAVQQFGAGGVEVYVTQFRAMKHTLSGRDEQTLMKLVVERATQRVLGCHMVGADAPEIIQGLAVALQCGATKAQFDATIGIHPTAAEEFVTMREKRPAMAVA